MTLTAGSKRPNATVEGPPTKKAKFLDDDSSSERPSDGEETLKINQDYARRFEHNKKRTEMHQLEEKYGSIKRHDGAVDGDTDILSSSEDELEDDTGELATEDLDAEIIATIEAIRSKDPRVYDASTKFYKESIEQEGNLPATNHNKPLFLKDYHRKSLLEGAGLEAQTEHAPPPQTYTQEQEALKQSLVTAMHATAATTEELDSGDESDTFLKAKNVESSEEASRVPIPDPRAADHEPENYLSNFLASRAWIPTTSSRFAPLESDDEDDEARAEAFEEAYNMRFEDPELSNQKLLSHARDAAAKYSVRREETSGRKKVREKERIKKEGEKAERAVERARLRKLKVEQIEDKVARIREAAGLSGKAVDLGEWAKVLEEDWNDARFDEEMQKRFGEDYYVEDSDASNSGANKGTTANMRAGKKKPRKPVWDDDIGIKDLIPDFDDEDQPTSTFPLSDDDAAHSRRVQKVANSDAKATARRDRRMIEALVDQSLPLEAASSSSKDVTRFRYRNTSPTTFGLTPLDILAADDTQLNQFAGLKKLAAFRDPERKRKDKKKLGKKARLRQWRMDTFGKEDGPRQEDIFTPGYLNAATGVEELGDISDKILANGSKQKKKKRRGKK